MTERAWHEAFEAAGTTMDAEATRELGEWDELPWDHVQSGVTTEFLLDEWWQSRAEVATGDCRWDGCADGPTGPTHLPAPLGPLFVPSTNRAAA